MQACEPYGTPGQAGRQAIRKSGRRAWPSNRLANTHQEEEMVRHAEPFRPCSQGGPVEASFSQGLQVGNMAQDKALMLGAAFQAGMKRQ